MSYFLKATKLLIIVSMLGLAACGKSQKTTQISGSQDTTNSHLNHCERKSIELALHLYLLNAGVIQGSDPEAELTYKEAQSDGNLYTIEISDGNDEGEYWTATYEVKIAGRTNACHIKSMTEISIQ